MIKHTAINQLKSHLGEVITIAGFVHAFRDQGKIKFARIRDASGSIQLVILKNYESAFKAELTIESVVLVTGLVKEAGQVPEGIEIEAQEFVVLSEAASILPIPVAAEKGADEVDIVNRLDYRWLDLRKPENQKIFYVWTELEAGMREYLFKEGFTQIYAPSFMSTASESGAEVFEVKYFQTKAYLAQSPQFYKQMAIASGIEKVFMVGPVFRAELSFTTRHMTEFTGWDFEFAYVDSHHDVMDMEEAALKSGFARLKAKGLIEEEITVPFTRLTLAEVKAKLATKGIPSEKVHDLSPVEEREISALIKEETGSNFLFVTDYPIAARPFYHMRHEDNPGLTKSFDLLYKGLEITTGAQREHRIDVLTKQAQEKGMDEKSLADYLNFFRFGCPPHGGVGIGPGRIVQQILGLASVKEATFLPRDVKRLRP
ncbi:MAG: aspartate--tRNA(Asn) ligase [bacterium]